MLRGGKEKQRKTKKATGVSSQFERKKFCYRRASFTEYSQRNQPGKGENARQREKKRKTKVIKALLEGMIWSSITEVQAGCEMTAGLGLGETILGASIIGSQKQGR